MHSDKSSDSLPRLLYSIRHNALHIYIYIYIISFSLSTTSIHIYRYLEKHYLHTNKQTARAIIELNRLLNTYFDLSLI